MWERASSKAKGASLGSTVGGRGYVQHENGIDVLACVCFIGKIKQKSVTLNS